MLINRIVFDLDVLATVSQPPSTEYLEGGELGKLHRPLSSERLEETRGDGPLVDDGVLTEAADGEKCLPRQSQSGGLRLRSDSPKSPPANDDDDGQASPVTPSLLQSYKTPEEPLPPSSYEDVIPGPDQFKLQAPPAHMDAAAAGQLEAGECELMEAKAQVQPLTSSESESKVHQMLEELEWDTFSPTVGDQGEGGAIGNIASESEFSLMSVPHLEFESRFESGNLRKAIQVK